MSDGKGKRKWLPLESDPTVFNRYAKALGCEDVQGEGNSEVRNSFIHQKPFLLKKKKKSADLKPSFFFFSFPSPPLSTSSFDLMNDRVVVRA